MILPVAILMSGLASAAPIFDVERGWVDAPFELNIDPEFKGGVIYYSTDGSDPTQLWTGPITVDPSATIRAVEEDPINGLSLPVTHTYLQMDEVLSDLRMDSNIVNDPVYGPIVTKTLTEMPTVALSGLALTLIEKPITVEWFDPDGGTFQIESGAKVVGNASVIYPKNNIRLYFRSEYGYTKLHFDLFDDYASGLPPADTHDSLNLRSGSHDSVFYLASAAQYLRNRWMDETQLALGHIVPHGRFVHVFVNRVYHGIYHVRERFNAAFLAAYMGGEKEDYEAVNGGVAFDGSGAAWASVVANSGNYEEIKRWLNPEAFVEYMIIQYYAANAWDWTYNHNWMAAGSATSDGFRFTFHSSDSDICFYYGWNANILYLWGPDYIFYYLLSEGHPDFLTLLADRIHALLQDDGVLTEHRAGDRYQRLSTQIEEAVVAESARWGSHCCGGWDRDEEWETERSRLMNDFFPYRSTELLRQMREAGWYPLDAPIISLAPPKGKNDPVTTIEELDLYPPGTIVDISRPKGEEAEVGDIYFTIDGSDPRVAGGASIAINAQGPYTQVEFPVTASTRINARMLRDDLWGPLQTSFVEVDQPATVILNEWNAVGVDKFLADNGADATLGQLPENGGEWMELLVVAPEIDMRGWKLTMTGRGGSYNELHFSDHPLLAQLRGGTLFTISAEIPEDASYDPDAGDWRFNLVASVDGSGLYITAADFDIDHREWQLTLWDAEGHIAYGPVGEGVAPSDGISSSEVGLLAANPSSTTSRHSSDYIDASESTFGAANQWADQVQDLSTLRGDPVSEKDPPPPPETDTNDSDTQAPPQDTEDTEDTGWAAPSAEESSGCSCAAVNSRPSQGAGVILTLALLGWRRRRLLLGSVLLAGCNGPDVTDTVAAETTETASSTTTSTTTSTNPSCFIDADEDGYGDPERFDAACTEGSVWDDRDCNDDDPWINPGMPEVCDTVDNDCDGWIDAEDDDLADGILFYQDQDGDGYGAAEVFTCTLKKGMALVAGDCDDIDPAIHPDATELCDDIDQDCDGTATDSVGISEECAALNCLDILTINPTATDGAYWLSLKTGTQPFWCDMTTNGGGWTLGFLKNSMDTSYYGDFASGTRAIEQLGLSPAEASVSETPVAAWFDLNSGWSSIFLASYAKGIHTYSSREIPTSALRIPFGENGYYLYDDGTGYYWCGGDYSYTDYGVGAVDNPVGAPLDCKYHGGLGSGWDFSEADFYNYGLTLCGYEWLGFMNGSWAGAWYTLGTSGAAQAIWVR